ncbi:Regulatory protein RecX OS=Tsukamurella paurometabola (strain ATCC 8368 / DSM / CCUG 35730 /CIP 100753 / JCM 10117 / KCTC 9821 / NBRC 16120 / NCIMB 702349/ NCTC 13040) OX=521096 GN=recX PE=3 SV=1 [Tsukamurella paurometabola]|uniref:Regulatory protein RecX n=1 Tax=Tsukamurella paurometabola (strain ATCC 8368 / DSM 20162 / CCUG 35730 / CIP 100753 / JCM 10117 / KCTC 9821 / NBRC 16120 / NCIMB 702349 / NCTC 13040) TaxID=521096 RepID=D5UMC4_TSUPD|nr:regulatory protein RecX [Tsukamurella paurometabola]ADG78404.1 regulatory protein RecX [Tsukamurella paurometabola DSM 20162]SUP31503.1 Regulatory protein recX [Tsukamurella paurometabola]
MSDYSDDEVVSRRRRRGRKSRDAEGGGPERQVEQDPAKREALARDVIYRALGTRDHSRGELRTKLARKGFDDELTERMLDKFAAAGLVDDAAFAQRWVESRHRYSGRGRRALAQELRTKGIGEADAAAALETVSRDDEQERATELVERKLARVAIPDDRAERDKLTQRLVGMLARRGYHPSLALSVVLDAVRAQAAAE